MDPQPGLSVEARAGPAAGGTAGLKIVFKGTGVKRLLNSGSKRQGSSWRQDDGSEQQDAASPSQGDAAVSDSPGAPFSPSSAEPSPDAAAVGGRGSSAGPAWAGPPSVHGQPPGKLPYPDDRTPEAEAARAQVHPQQATVGAEAAEAAAPLSAADGVALGPRSVHGHPPGKQPHPDDPAFAPPGGARQQQQQQRLGGQAAQRAEVAQPPHVEHPGGAAATAAGPRSVHGQPPGKQPDQIYQIEAAASVQVGQGSEEHAAQPARPHAAAAGPLPQAPWRWQQAVPPLGGQAYAPAPAGSSHQARPHLVPPPPGSGASVAEKPSSRKRPASQAGEGGQRKKTANGAAAGGVVGGGLQRHPSGVAAPRSFSAGVSASLARSGEAPPQIRPMPGAPRSLQQRQQLVNGAIGGATRQPAGAPRPKQPGSAAASKPKHSANKAGGSGQRRTVVAVGAGQPAGAPTARYQTGDVVWAKIGNYPWWPAQLQNPVTDEHFKPKHAASDLFCVFYGSNDYNWLPASALKPFSETHPDYSKHAAVKNKALQRAIDEAWVYGVQRQRPDVNYAPYGGTT